MILIDSKFQLEIPIHIEFTLYKHNYIDNLIINSVKTHCKDLEIYNNQLVIDVESIKTALLLNEKLNKEVKNSEIYNIRNTINFNPNSVYFLWNIFKELKNLNRVTANISNDSNYTRLYNINEKKMVSFFISVKEGLFDLTKIFDKNQLNNINKLFINLNLIENNYLKRSSYFRMQSNDLLDLLSNYNYGFLVDQLDPKIIDDNPVLIIKTDYTMY